MGNIFLANNDSVSASESNTGDFEILKKILFSSEFSNEQRKRFFDLVADPNKYDDLKGVIDNYFSKLSNDYLSKDYLNSKGLPKDSPTNIGSNLTNKENIISHLPKILSVTSYKKDFYLQLKVDTQGFVTGPVIKVAITTKVAPEVFKSNVGQVDQESEKSFATIFYKAFNIAANYNDKQVVNGTDSNIFTKYASDSVMADFIKVDIVDSASNDDKSDTESIISNSSATNSFYSLSNNISDSESLYKTADGSTNYNDNTAKNTTRLNAAKHYAATTLRSTNYRVDRYSLRVASIDNMPALRIAHEKVMKQFSWREGSSKIAKIKEITEDKKIKINQGISKKINDFISLVDTKMSEKPQSYKLGDPDDNTVQNTYNKLIAELQRIDPEYNTVKADSKISDYNCSKKINDFTALVNKQMTSAEKTDTSPEKSVKKKYEALIKDLNEINPNFDKVKVDELYKNYNKFENKSQNNAISEKDSAKPLSWIQQFANSSLLYTFSENKNSPHK